jgi:Tol biopolymer transport system component
LEPLGEGGMGGVYKAEDTRLKRLVALKFLSRDVTGTGEHAERFLREAQAAAALDHPNICTVHEIDQQDGQMFLAMAYLDGVALDERIQGGPLPLDSVYEIAKQAAEGLAAAHRAGVVHRDIKSSNIMVSEDRTGRPVVRLMDFGLAQVSGASKLTRVDTRMGTVAYMSPEQSLGEAVGPASDLWSLGVVIYEMVAGELPFKGHYDQAILYSILNEEPSPLTALRSRVPMELEWIVEKCLAKAPADRYQDAGELVVDLDMLARRASSGRTTVQPLGPSATGDPGIRPDAREIAAGRAGAWTAMRALLRSKAALAGALVTLALALFLGLASLEGDESPAEPTRRFTLRPVETIQGGQRIGHLAISPDGRNIAFSTTGSGGSLWLQPLDRHDPIQVEGTKGARDVFWSPDSNFVGFATNRGIGKVALRGLTVTMLAEDADFAHSSATWSVDGQSIVFTSRGGRTMMVSALGGVPRPLPFSAPRRRTLVTSPSLIGVGEGEQILLYAEHALDGDSVMARRLSDDELGEAVRLVEGASPVYSQSGHIVFRPSLTNSALWAVGFSPEDLEVRGEPFLVAQNGSEASVSSDGTLVYLDNPYTGQMRLVWVNSQGETVGEIGKEQAWILGPRVSPSGEKVLVSGGRGRDADLWVHEAGRPVLSRLTFDDLEETGAIWSPDSRQVAFMQRGSPDLMLLSVGGGSPPQTIYTSEDGAIDPLDWSRDGRYILLQKRIWQGDGPRGGQAPLKKAQGHLLNSGIVYLEQAGADRTWAPREFLPVAPFAVDDAVFSPDGRYVAYESNESDDFEVYVKPFPSGEQRWQVTTDGGRLARWSGDGKELYYVRDDTLFAVAVETMEGFQTAESRPLFTNDSLLGFRRHATYDVGPGNRFALVGHAQNPRPPSIRVVLNWLSQFQTL